MHDPEPVYILYSAEQLKHHLARSALREGISRYQILEEFSATRQFHNEVIFIKSGIRMLKLKNVVMIHFL